MKLWKTRNEQGFYTRCGPLLIRNVIPASKNSIHRLKTLSMILKNLTKFHQKNCLGFTSISIVLTEYQKASWVTWIQSFNCFLRTFLRVQTISLKMLWKSIISNLSNSIPLILWRLSLKFNLSSKRFKEISFLHTKNSSSVRTCICASYCCKYFSTRR